MVPISTSASASFCSDGGGGAVQCAGVTLQPDGGLSPAAPSAYAAWADAGNWTGAPNIISRMQYPMLIGSTVGSNLATGTLLELPTGNPLTIASAEATTSYDPVLAVNQITYTKTAGALFVVMNYLGSNVQPAINTEQFQVRWDGSATSTGSFTAGTYFQGASVDAGAALFGSVTVSGNATIPNGTASTDAAAFGQLRPYSLWGGACLSAVPSATDDCATEGAAPAAGEVTHLDFQVQTAGTGAGTFGIVFEQGGTAICTSTAEPCTSTGNLDVACTGTWASGAALTMLLDTTACTVGPQGGITSAITWQ